MNADEMAVLAASFARGASDYDRFRPEFPVRLFDDLQTRAGDRLDGRVLEVGAGTGRATLPLARLGAGIEVVEPSEDMLRVLRERLESEALTDQVVLRQAKFEDVDPVACYDVVVAAQSFHWADVATRWSRLGGLLGSGGVAFLLWNGWHLDGTLHDVEAVRAVYAEHGEGFAPDLADCRSTGEWAQLEIEAEPSLTLAESLTYQWEHTLSAKDYMKLLSTTSQYAVASSDSRERLFSHLSAAVGPTVFLSGGTLMLVVEPSTTLIAS